MKVQWRRTLVRPALATAVMSGAVYGVYALVRSVWSVGGGVLVATLVGIAVYALCVLRFGVIGPRGVPPLAGRNQAGVLDASDWMVEIDGIDRSGLGPGRSRM